MKILFNDLKRGYLKYKEEYEEKVLEILNSGWYILGKEVENFENSFAQSLNVKYCVGVASGLDAITLGIKALNIGMGDEVIVQSNTYIATVMGITLNGATPIFVEPDKYYNMNPEKIEKKITNKTRAILVTNLYGQASKLDEIKVIADRNNLYLIEDCAQSHFSKYNNKFTGTFGEMGFFSFYPTKNLGAFGDGGAIITNNSFYAKRIRILRNYGSDQKYHNLEVGVNSRLDEIQAGLLSIKLKHMPEIVNERRKIANIYLTKIKNPLIKLPEIAENATHVWHLFVIRTKNRNNFQEYMKQNSIVTDIHYPIPPHLSKAYEYLNYKKGNFPIAEAFSDTLLSIPLYNNMNIEEIEYIIKVINDYRG